VSLVVSGYPTSTAPGASHSFTVTAKDTGGNTAVSYTGTVHFTSTDGAASIHDRFEVKEAGLDAFLVYDAYSRLSLFDHWLRSDQDRGAFERGQLPDTIGLRGTWRVAIAREPDGAHAVLRRATADRALVIEKTVGVMRDGARMRVAYRVETMARSLEPGWFGMEWNFAMLDARSPGRRFRIGGESEERSLGSSGEVGSVREVTLIDRDRSFQVRLAWNLDARLWWAPVETVSLDPSVMQFTGQREALGDRRLVMMKGGIEAGNLKQFRSTHQQRPDRCEVVRLMQGCEGNVLLETRDHALVDDHRPVIFRPAMDDPVANRDEVEALGLPEPSRHHGNRCGNVGDLVRRIDPIDQR
jgi:hypothetical protein